MSTLHYGKFHDGVIVIDCIYAMFNHNNHKKYMHVHEESLVTSQLPSSIMQAQMRQLTALQQHLSHLDKDDPTFNNNLANDLKDLSHKLSNEHV